MSFRKCLVGFLVLFSVLPILLYLYFYQGVSRFSGSAQLDGLQQSLEVVYDKHAVAHISGTELLDVTRGQGYVHAQHRMWQMEMFRMTAQGRLSEIFGETTLPTDIFLRTLDFKGYSRQSYSVLQDETKALLEAYAEGVNAFLEQHSRSVFSKLSPEFKIFSHQPEPWQPWHSLLTIKLMDLTLGANMRPEINRLAFAARGLSPAEIDDLMGYAAEDSPPPLPDLRKLYGFRDDLQAAVMQPSSTLINAVIQGYNLPWSIGVSASNNWVVAGSRTQSGKPLLTNDPHLGLTAPSTWFLNHLQYQKAGRRMNMMGASIPSVPLIMLGRNDHVAWGFTTSYLDAQDIFIEKINPQDPEQYLTEQGWANFEQAVETIQISDADNVSFVRRRSRHGPVLPGRFQNLQDILPAGHVAALQWTSLTENDTTVDALMQISQATSVESFKQALRPMVSPMQTIVAADTQGHIAMIAPAQMVVRHEANLVKGRAPVPGWLAQYQWQATLGFEQWPQSTDPDSGVLFSANYKFVDEHYPHHITYDWGRQYRHYRAKQLLEDVAGKHSPESMLAVVADDYSQPLILLRDQLLPELISAENLDQALVQSLQAWNGRMHSKAPQPLIMMAIFKQLATDMLSDELGKDFKRINRELDINIVLKVLAEKTARNWCDDLKTVESENCSQLVKLSVARSLLDLQQQYGDDWRQWQWGEAHIAYNEHRPFAKVAMLADLFNVQVASGGGPFTLLRGQTDFNAKQPFYNRAAATFRAVYDFADLEKSLFIHNTGQSGHFLSAHYDDYAHRWAGVEFIPMWVKPENYENNLLGRWDFYR